MLDLLRTRLKQGTRTSGFPREAPEFPERFRGRPAFDASRCGDGCRECAPSLPSPLIQLGATATAAATVDVGACLFSPEEAAMCPEGAVSFTREFRMASSTRQGLHSTTGEVELARALDQRSRRLFGRSLRLRSVAAGSCNGCESELVALGNVVFDLARFGVQFVASPRHADGIVVTGAVSANMSAALRATYDAVPDPRLVIAVGACAINGGPFRGSPEVGHGVPDDLPVDLWVPGCPPHPLTVLDGVLRLLGRIEEDAARPKPGSRTLTR
jgi:Ni,Fe-hydrogenase III small subunit/formate hydrogenlyase subunit 6/NADH:ubiquinone oxidoreductase subunit I